MNDHSAEQSNLKERGRWTPPPLENISEIEPTNANYDSLLTRIVNSERYRAFKRRSLKLWGEFLSGTLRSQTDGSERVNQLIATTRQRIDRKPADAVATSAAANSAQKQSDPVLMHHNDHEIRGVASNKPAPLALIAAGAMIVSFFLPWAQLFGVGASGYQLAQIGSYANLAWLIPAAGAVVFCCNLAIAESRPIQVLAGTVPWAGLFYGLANVGGDMFHILSIGPYIALVAGAILILAPSRTVVGSRI